MNSEEYIEQVVSTESNDWETIKERISDDNILRMLHAVIGMSTEAGELLDVLKKYIFYGKELDFVNIEEELGDSNWYQSLMIHALKLKEYHTSWELICEKNINKLNARYGEKFSESAAQERDLEKEREILEVGNNCTQYATCPCTEPFFKMKDPCPGWCPECKEPWVWVRPGQSQPNCDCQEMIKEGFDNE